MLVRTPFLLLASVALVAASGLSERSANPESAFGAASELAHRRLAKRGLLSSIFCSIGVASACGNSNTGSVNTINDVRNCGAIGNVCPSSFANGIGSVTCQSSACISSCSAGFSFSVAQQTCTDLNVDVNNCGAVGRACNYGNGNAVCVAGSCAIASCNSGFFLVNGQCAALTYYNDVNNCGAQGTACSTPAGASSVSCNQGQCQVNSCAAGYTKSGNTCQANTQNSDPKNCGAIGRQCVGSYLNGVGSTCQNGICQPRSCVAGFAFDYAISACRSITTDPNNCGSVGNSCAISNGVGACVSSSCVVVSCNAPAKLLGGVCMTTGASPRARMKKSKIVKAVKLCPEGESACPIIGSESYQAARENGFLAFRRAEAANPKSLGGYECLETSFSLESCGGCASMGEGQDCTQIPHASSVGCDAGRCIIFSCKAGFQPNFDHTGCIEIEAGSEVAASRSLSPSSSSSRSRRHHSKRSRTLMGKKVHKHGQRDPLHAIAPTAVN